jgi:hypothetical protein
LARAGWGVKFVKERDVFGMLKVRPYFKIVGTVHMA